MNPHIGKKPLVHRGRSSIATYGVGDGGRRWDKIALCSASCHITLNRTASKMCARNLTLPKEQDVIRNIALVQRRNR